MSKGTSELVGQTSGPVPPKEPRKAKPAQPAQGAKPRPAGQGKPGTRGPRRDDPIL